MARFLWKIRGGNTAGSGNGPRGFTFIELLVVIAIIAIFFNEPGA